MIYLEQAGQPSRVIFTELQAVDQPQQPFQQGMTAPEETGGYGTNAAAEPGLFPGRPHRLPVCPVEGAGDPADLVGGPTVDRRDPGTLHPGSRPDPSADIPARARPRPRT